MIQGKTITRLSALAFVVLWLNAATPATAASDSFRADGTWRTSTPERQGFDSVELAKIFDFVRANEVDFNSLIIVRNGYLILEAYFYPFQRDLIHDVASVTKSMTSLLTGIAIDEGRIKGVQERALSFFPERTPARLNDNKRSLTIEHLLTMMSGLCLGPRDGEGQPGAMRLSPDNVQFMLDQPLVTAPGSAFAYCSLAPHLLSAIITRTTGSSELEFARKNLFGPLGIDRVEWPADCQGNSFGWGDLFIRPIDLAKIGCLLLNEGLWNGTRIVSREWIRTSSRMHVREGESTGYGYLWWLPLSNPGLFEGRGRGGQRLSLWPERNLLVVMIGNGGHDPGDVGTIIGRALKSDGPLPENPTALRALENKIREAESAPAPRPLGPPPPLAARISGTTFVLESNPLGFESFSIDFGKEKEEAVLRLSAGDSFGGEASLKVIPVGLDGVYRFSNNSRFGLPMAAKGSWASDREFIAVLNEAANDRAFDIRVRFDEDSAELAVSERTGLMDLTIVRGRAKR